MAALIQSTKCSQDKARPGITAGPFYFVEMAPSATTQILSSQNLLKEGIGQALKKFSSKLFSA